MKNKILKIAYGFIGVFLFTCYLATGVYGLSNTDKECYKQALELQDYVDTLGFSKLHLIDYPVAVYTGDTEYVMHGDIVTTRKPVLDALAGTAYRVDDHYEVFVPTFNDMRNTANAIGFAATPENIPGYQQSNHISAIWHEALHAWQLTFYKENIEKLFPEIHKNPGTQNEILTLNDNAVYKRLFHEERNLLIKAIEADKAGMTQTLTQWAELLGKYDNVLTDGQKEAVSYYELIEGSARYVESKVFGHLEGDEACRENYLILSNDTNGSSKYYQLGMFKCVIMDRLNPGWQVEFACNQDLNTLILNAINKGD